MTKSNEDSGALRRPPRSTVRFLSMLPKESFPNPADMDAITSRRWEQLRISSIQHPLISDAINRFAQGMPTRHGQISIAVGRPVFEVRDRTGAAWRGLVILDEHDDPWLVWAANHDDFHAKQTPRNLKNSFSQFLPSAIEYKLRDRDEAQLHHTEWKRQAISTVLASLSKAIQSSPAEESVKIPSLDSPQETLTVKITVEHDEPEEDLTNSESLMNIHLRVGDHSLSKTRDEIVACILPLLQPDRERIDSTWTIDGQLDIWVTVTQAKIAQLVATQQIETDDELLDKVCAPNTVLHYVADRYLTEALITGLAIRSICGIWFTPTDDESSTLPICPRCEERKPFAELATELMRQSLF